MELKTTEKLKVMKMRVRQDYTFLLTINILFLLFILSNSVLNAQHISAYTVRKIVVDAGHGGKDPGTVGKLSQEKDITLAIAKRLGELITSNIEGVTVIYTRTDDTFIPLDERSQIANKAGADLFVSIHCNAAPNKSVTGTETYVMGLHRSNENLDVAMRENAVITYESDYKERYEGYDPNSAESFIIFTMLQNAYLDQSLDIASILQNDFKNRAQRIDRGVRQAGFLVLWKTSMPSILVEVGYLSNPKEEAFLMSKEGQEIIASSIFRTIKRYKTKVDEYNLAITKPSIPTEKTDSVNTIIQTETPKHKESPSIQFKIQIAASQTPISAKNEQLKGFKKVDIINSNGIFKYLVGGTNSYSEAQEYCKIVKQKVPDAFVVAVENGQLIPIKIAMEKINVTN